MNHGHGWLFAALKKGRAASTRPAEGPPPSDERLRRETVETRALFIKLEQEFEGRKGARVHNVTSETDINQTSFGDSVHCATHNGDPDLFKAALDRAEADLRAMKALLAEVGVKQDDMRQQRDDALRDRDDWRSQAEHWKAQAQRLTLGLPAPRSAAEPDAASRVPLGSARNDARAAQPAVVVALAQARRPQLTELRAGYKRRSNNPSLKRPDIPVAPE